MDDTKITIKLAELSNRAWEAQIKITIMDGNEWDVTLHNSTVTGPFLTRSDAYKGATNYIGERLD